MFAKCRALPVVVPEPEIATHVAEVLRWARTDTARETNEVVAALTQLRTRQSYYWRPFAPDVVAAIEGWMLEAWRDDPALDLDSWAGLVTVGDGSPRDPGMPRAMTLLREIAASDPRPDVRALAQERLTDIQYDAIGAEKQTGKPYPAVFTGRPA